METEDVFRVMGYLDVISQEGVEWFDHNKAPFVAVDLPFGPQRQVMVNPRVLEYEKLVSLAQLKVHRTATVTLSIKNIAMSFPAADFYGHPRVSQKLHPHNILKDKQAFLVGMLMRFPIDLAIVVGHPAMIGTGPDRRQGGRDRPGHRRPQPGLGRLRRRLPPRLRDPGRPAPPPGRPARPRRPLLRPGEGRRAGPAQDRRHVRRGGRQDLPAAAYGQVFPSFE